MKNMNHLLSFITDEDGGMLTIHADLDGLSLLIDRLSLLRDLVIKGDCPHTHLYSVEAAGEELSSTTIENQPNERNIINHVKIYGWSDEWAVRHGLRSTVKGEDDKTY